MIRLSILIPSIPARIEKATSLYERIIEMVGDMDIEVLMFIDNKKRTIGEKRENLKNASNGKYFMFVDDDDDILSISEIYEATNSDVDVISFISECRNPDGSTFLVDMSLGNDVEHNTEDGRYLDCKRPPFQMCAFNKKFKWYPYPFVNYSEDWGWLKNVLPKCKNQVYIPKVIHKYNFDPNVSEASTESNSEWKNPNLHEEKSDS